MLAAILAVLFLLRFIWNFNKFDDIFLLTECAAGTRTLTVSVYEQAIALGNIGAGAAVAVIVFFVLLVCSLSIIQFSPKEANLMKHSALHALVIGFLWASFCHLLALTVSGLGLGQLIQMSAWPRLSAGRDTWFGRPILVTLQSRGYIFLIAGFAGLGLSKSPAYALQLALYLGLGIYWIDTRHDGASTIAIDWSFCGYAG